MRVVVSQAEFSRARADLLELASRGIEVVVNDEQGKPRTIYCTPRDVRPCMF